MTVQYVATENQFTMIAVGEEKVASFSIFIATIVTLNE